MATSPSELSSRSIVCALSLIACAPDSALDLANVTPSWVTIGRLPVGGSGRRAGHRRIFYPQGISGVSSDHNEFLVHLEFPNAEKLAFTRIGWAPSSFPRWRLSS